MTSYNNGQLHGFAALGTILLAGSLFSATIYLAQASERPHEPPLKEMMTIEASLARKSVKKQQPQKVEKAPEPPPKPEGVSHDENKIPPVKPKDEPKKPPPRQPDVPLDKRFHHASDDDPQTGGPATDPGQFDGSEKGFAPLNAGDPYWRNLAGDIHQAWEIPTISKVNGSATGCFHIEADGKISGIKPPEGGDDTLNDSVQRALKATQATRNEKPQPVPTEQLGVIRKWVCFRFNPNQ